MEKAKIRVEDAKRLCRMLYNYCEIIVDNYCFVNKLDTKAEYDEVFGATLSYFYSAIDEALEGKDEEDAGKNNPKSD